jgi:hypothetical protein
MHHAKPNARVDYHFQFNHFADLQKSLAMVIEIRLETAIFVFVDGVLGKSQVEYHTIRLVSDATRKEKISTNTLRRN